MFLCVFYSFVPIQHGIGYIQHYRTQQPSELLPLHLMSIKKIINDPIYGLIRFPFEILYDIIDHPIFQRLRRISQMGLSTYVYPGATHSRFSHALGALHLMTNAIETLKAKGNTVTDDEYQGVCIAILLHDIGHGPFSHALEGMIIDTSHEDISLLLMEKLNIEYKGQLDTAISIFTSKHPKKYLTQLVSSQLDMDRMDYLTRDSYYSGVAEGVIGYKRIISMINVSDNQLVIEEKGIFSIEKFLVARHIMYWQVYLHKNSIAAEQMLKKFIQRLKFLVVNEDYQIENETLCQLIGIKAVKNSKNGDTLNHKLEYFTKLDDIDVFQIIKSSITSADQVLRMLALGLLNRRLFKVILQKEPFDSDLLAEVRQNVKITKVLSKSELDDIIISGKETTKAYDPAYNEIKVLSKLGRVAPMSEHLDMLVNITDITKYYLCYPK